MRDQHRTANARTLAAAMGMDDEQAAPLLDRPIRVTWDTSISGAILLGEEILRLLRQTFSSVLDPYAAPGHCAVELLINGAAPMGTGGTRVYCWMDEVRLTIGESPHAEERPAAFPHPLLSLIGACYATAWVARAALGTQLGGVTPHPIRVDFRTFAPEPGVLSRPLEIGACHLAGAGAIGTAFLYAIRLLAVSGRLHIIDPKTVTGGILNRCAWFEAENIDENKAEVLARKAQTALPSLRLTSVVATLAEYNKVQSTPIARLIVAVDSRVARRHLQHEMPGEVFDASTTGIDEVVFHHNQQREGGACLACIYPRAASEVTHEQHVADLLNVSMVDIASGFVDDDAATRILVKYPKLARGDLVGRAYDSLFARLCATAELRGDEDRQVLAPFGFVSMLAGAILALELVLRVHGPKRAFNYWRASPWTQPNADLQLDRERDPGCDVCSKSAYQALASELWRNEPPVGLVLTAARFHVA